MTGPSFILKLTTFDSSFIVDYSLFASSDFDPNEYANAILATDHHPEFKLGSKLSTPLKTSTHDSIAKEDISMAISKLTFGIEDVSKQIRNLV
jgi:hypothetical protein